MNDRMNKTEWFEYKLNAMHNSAITLREKAVAHLSNPDNWIRSWEVDALAEAAGKQQVSATVRAWMEHARSEKQDEDEMFVALKQRIVESALRSHKPNSTSEGSVQIDLNIHFAWVELANELSYL